MKKTTKKRLIANIAYPLIAFGLMLAVWAIVAAAKGDKFLFPYPGEVLNGYFELLGTAAFWVALSGSLGRIILCFLIAFSAALVLSLAGGTLRPVHRVLSPVISVLRSAPTMAFILLAMIWIDYNKIPVSVGLLIAFPVLYSAFYAAITGVDSDLLQMAKVYGVSRFNTVRFIYVPSIMPAVFEGSRSTISLTAKTVIAAEILCAVKDSLGQGMQRANLTFQIAELMSWVISAIVLSFVLEGAVLVLHKLWLNRSKIADKLRKGAN